MSTIVLASPSSLVASLPFLVGFTPEESVVLVWLREGSIVLTQRADLPRVVRQDWLLTLWQHATAPEADAIVIVGTSSDPRVSRVVVSVAEYAVARGLVVRDALVVSNGSWSSVLCSEPSCCCHQPQAIPESVRMAVAAEFAYLGVAPATSRQSLEIEVQARVDPLVIRQLSQRGIRRPSTVHAVEVWRNRAIDETCAWLTGSPESRASLARVIAGLQDVRVRDVFLWDCASAEHDALRRVIPRLQEGVRCAPESLVAPVATVCAVVWWLLGDGARARLSIGRCVQADPEYLLGQLIAQAIAAGLPPSAWRSAAMGISRKQCRDGSRVVASGAATVL
ncbi:MAG: DUF4192 domain-containing protein [Actinomycetes bacterium]|jgi:Domain of unknown function (DUF4192)